MMDVWCYQFFMFPQFKTVSNLVGPHTDSTLPSVGSVGDQSAASPY